jgi:hypothetical protein
VYQPNSREPRANEDRTAAADPGPTRSITSPGSRTGTRARTRALHPAARYGLAGALLALAAAGCSGNAAPGSSDIALCGTTLWHSQESLHPYQVPAAHPGPGTPAAPASSQLPPALGTAVAAGSDPLAVVPAVVLVTDDCSSDPVVTVTPAAAARTVTVAHTAPGGVAGLYLGLTKDPVTVREYENGSLVGLLQLP